VLLDDVATFVDTSTALTVGTDLFKGLMPDTPDACVALYETPGEMALEMGGGSTPTVERPHLQVISRAADYVTARNNSQTVHNAIRGVTDQTLSGRRYLRIQPLQDPYMMGRDENRRVKVVFNCSVEKEPG